MISSKTTNARTYLSISMLLGILMLGIALIAPAAAKADDQHSNRDHHKQKVKRYYDKKSHDYHEWNENEDRAYRVYLQENHREYREFRVERRPQQEMYFGWRHDHPDSALFKVEIR